VFANVNKKDKLRECIDNADFAIMTQARELRLAKRMARLGTETAFEVLVKARALEAKGRDIIHLEIGEPDFDTPANIIDAACDALHKSFTHYGPSAGLPQLREVIAQHVSETRRINVTPEEVVIVPGGKPIIFFGILALVEDGDEVIYPNPGFPIYESMINYVGAKAVPIRLREDLDFRLDVDELAGLINDRTKLIILNSPQNPTGGVLEKKDIDGIARTGDQFRINRMEIGAIRHTEGCENYAEIERRQTPRFAMLSAVIGENNGSIRRFSGAKTMIACGLRDRSN